MEKERNFCSMKTAHRSNDQVQARQRLMALWRRRAAQVAALAISAWLIAACDSADHEKRVIAARLETMETEKRLLLEQLARLETDAERLRSEVSQAEQEEQMIQREQEALLTANPLIVASLGGAGSAIEEYEQSQAQQREIDGGAALVGLLAAAYLAMNPGDTANVLAETELLEQRAKDVALRRSGIERDLEEKRVQTRTSREKLADLEAAILEEHSRL
jgi:hypothetical protein